MSRPIPYAPKRQFLPPPIVEEISAGGVVISMSAGFPQVAIISRTNRGGKQEWCLPKGHLESGETQEEAAIREVYEETGILGTIIQKLGSIDYRFVVNGTRIHKTVHHFLMDMVSGYLTVENDPDHEADDAIWVEFSELKDHLTFPNEKHIATMAYELFMRD